MSFETRPLLVALLAACLSGCLLAGCGEDTRPAAEAARAGPQVEAATVNGQVIYVSEVEMEARMKGLIKDEKELKPGSAEFNDVLDELIEVKLLAMEALNRGLDEDPEARHRLATARDNILGNILLEHVADEEMDETAVRKMYDTNVELLEQQMENEARVRHILAPSKDAIDKIAAELKTGVDFAVLAARRTSDEATRLDGGDLGYMTADEASPEFARVIREVPAGGVSRPFEDSTGWHIVKIDELRKRRPPSLEDLRDKIERYMKSQQLEKLLKQLRAEADIVKYDAPRSASLDAPVAAPRVVRPDPAPVTPAVADPALSDPALVDPGPAEPTAAAPVPETREPTAKPAAPQLTTPKPAAPKPETPKPAAPQ